jgi:hypothetical protein
MLVDDERYKCITKERDQLIWVPKWDEERNDDLIISTLVDALLRFVHDDQDIRSAVPRINRAIRKYKRQHLKNV